MNTSDVISGKTKSEWLTSFDNAGAAIQLRLQRDVFQQISEEEQTKRTDEIMKDSRVEKLLNTQDSTGWFSPLFHGYDSMEASIRFLLEMGLSYESVPLHQAAFALFSASTDQLSRGIGKAGRLLEERGVSGSETIRAWLLALLGREDCEFVGTSIEKALQAVFFAEHVSSMSEVTFSKNGYMYLLPDCLWPDLYHFRLLAATQQWRTADTLKRIGSSVENMCRLQPIPNIHIYADNRPVAPGAFGLQNLTPEFDTLSSSEWMPWFQRMILFAQLGILDTSDSLQSYYRAFVFWLNQWNGWFTLPLQHTYFSRWGAYTGLMLEQNWRKNERRIFDLTFRCLQIESIRISVKESIVKNHNGNLP